MGTKTDKTTQLKPSAAKTQPPSMYQVVMHNDDFTPMDFVVSVLMEVFSHQHETAHQIMLKIHTEGKGVCGVYPRDIATTKVEQVGAYAKQHEHPLLCSIEPV
jgi:ATP-dependent Clp protease adaptor protein ClpS